MLCAALDNAWIVYVKPHLDGGQPDFVVAHAQYGVCVIEVRDWTVGDYRQDFDGRIEVLSDHHWVRTTERPRAEANRFRGELIKRFFEEAGSATTKLGIVRAIVIMPRFRTGDARELLSIPQAGGRAEQSVEVWGGGMLKIAMMAVLTGREKPVRRKVPADTFERMCRALHLADASLELVP